MHVPRACRTHRVPCGAPQVPRDLEISMLMKKMALDKKNLGDSIRCTIVTDIGVSVTNPQPVDKKLMETVMA